MRNNRDRSLIKTFASWIKGIWGSFSRFIGRLTRPNRGRRVNVEMKSEESSSSPVRGLRQFLNAESLTIGELMGKVQWNTTTPTSKAVPTPNVKTIRNQINWD